ncbi:MAG TPA: transposase [Candidatus Micrarchaeia archaeon]|nr:transposase [Candidatus Micrarchaeia archaeon]
MVDTEGRFFAALGDERCRRIRRVSRDGASWIAGVVDERCPTAIPCPDPFHVVQGAIDALDAVRRQVGNAARKGGEPSLAPDLKGARWALWHNPENLTERQQASLAEIERTHQPLFRASLLKAEVRGVLHRSVRRGWPRLDRWIQWARRSRLAPFVKLARTITASGASIAAALRYGLSHARIESGNRKIRRIIRRSFGFHYPAALIALAKLRLGGLSPALPGRA